MSSSYLTAQQCHQNDKSQNQKQYELIDLNSPIFIFTARTRVSKHSNKSKSLLNAKLGQKNKASKEIAKCNPRTMTFFVRYGDSIKPNGCVECVYVAWMFEVMVCEWMEYEIRRSVMHLLLAQTWLDLGYDARLVEQEIKSFCLHSDLSLDPRSTMFGIFCFKRQFHFSSWAPLYLLFWFQSLYKAIVYPCTCRM